jgi:hypothetical protein
MLREVESPPAKAAISLLGCHSNPPRPQNAHQRTHRHAVLYSREADG